MGKNCDCIVCKWVNEKITDEEAVEILIHENDDWQYKYTKLEQKNKRLKKIIINTHNIMKTFDEQRAYEYLTNQIEALKE
jgi:hypothetical protein